MSDVTTSRGHLLAILCGLAVAILRGRFLHAWDLAEELKGTLEPRVTREQERRGCPACGWPRA